MTVSCVRAVLTILMTYWCVSDLPQRDGAFLRAADASAREHESVRGGPDRERQQGGGGVHFRFLCRHGERGEGAARHPPLWPP